MKTFGRWLSWPDAAAELAGYIGGDDVDHLAEAFLFAERHHAGQTRPAGEPYSLHLLEVTEILATEVGTTDVDLLAAALLHDVVEDTSATLTEVRDRFGPRAAELVVLVTMPAIGPDDDAVAVRHRYLTGLRDAPPDARRLKLADRYSNVQRLHTHPRIAKQRSYYAETCLHIIPVAAGDDVFDALFTSWRAAYDYLEKSVDSRADDR